MKHKMVVPLPGGGLEASVTGQAAGQWEQLHNLGMEEEETRVQLLVDSLCKS